MPKVGIICAGDDELAPFLPHIQNETVSEKAMLHFHAGTINSVEVVALFCGVCKTNAALATQILIDCYGVDCVINAGTAGGMDESLAVFDTVIATEVAHHDMGPHILTEFHPCMPSLYFKSDAQLLTLAQKAASRLSPPHKVYFGRMVTGEQFITDEGRARINAAFAPLSVDMETASIAQVCYVNGIPFIAVRCITDTATHSGVVNFDKNCATASGISKDIVLGLLGEMKVAIP